jgi:hypothetical protein
MTLLVNRQAMQSSSTAGTMAFPIANAMFVHPFPVKAKLTSGGKKNAGKLLSLLELAVDNTVDISFRVFPKYLYKFISQNEANMFEVVSTDISDSSVSLSSKLIISVQEWPENPEDTSTFISDFVKRHIVRQQVQYFHGVHLHNPKLDAEQTLRCFPRISDNMSSSFHGRHVQVRTDHL